MEFTLTAMVPTIERKMGQDATPTKPESHNTQIVKKHEISTEEYQEFVKKVGRPWFKRRKPIPVWKIKSLRNLGFSYSQIGKLFGVSSSTIKRRLRGA